MAEEVLQTLVSLLLKDRKNVFQIITLSWALSICLAVCTCVCKLKEIKTCTILKSSFKKKSERMEGRKKGTKKIKDLVCKINIHILGLVKNATFTLFVFQWWY